MSDRRIGHRIVRLASAGSTMDEAARLATAGAADGSVVVASAQTAGRGRAGRAWHAPAGTALFCSIVLRPTVPHARLSLLPLIAGERVATVIEQMAGLPCRLKWPNDVWLNGDGRKVAGLLMTARTATDSVEQAILGIGINVNSAIADLPPGATSMASEAGRLFDLDALLTDLLTALDTSYHAFLAAPNDDWLAGWRARAVYLDEPVSITIDDRRQTGIMRGVDDDGALLLETVGGDLTRIVAGDLVRGPVASGRDR